jgi:hypothetical protein
MLGLKRLAVAQYERAPGVPRAQPRASAHAGRLLAVGPAAATRPSRCIDVKRRSSTLPRADVLVAESPRIARSAGAGIVELTDRQVGLLYKNEAPVGRARPGTRPALLARPGEGARRGA